MKSGNTTPEELLLYAVTDRAWLNGETLYEQVEKALKGGATFVQLREKKLDEESFLQEAIEIKELCKKYNVPFVINDNVDIALKMDADGVHVGQSDMEAGDVRKKIGNDKIIGVSAQTVEQAIKAQERGADNVKELSGSGICGIAVISAIFAQENIEEATSKLKEKTLEMIK